MEVVQLAYRILFEIKVEIEGVSGDVNQYIKIVPDVDTRLLLGRYNILTKKQKNAHVFLIETEPSGPEEESPRIELDADEVFRFQIKFTDNGKFDGTHLRSYNWADEVLLVTNEANHISGTDLLLSLPLATYNSADDYLPGFLVTSGSDSFKALQASDSGNPHAVTETDFWIQITDDTVISQVDLQQRSALTFPVDLDTIIVVEINHTSTLPAGYELLDGSGKCLEVTYKINLLRSN